ncbi:MAG: hypothetical protein CVU57_12965 [Deltaproteobacteria bacterium HGW-Deltaproteobacteria-15]|jgi:hypothetical protein|nr:MAG: hypothetical protein CVU57_12965 [Deltaproteobacteria bacterium HGW-Deltaproteobacteria-15]
METGFEHLSSIMKTVLSELVKNSTRTATAAEASPGPEENREKKADALCGIFCQLKTMEDLSNRV